MPRIASARSKDSTVPPQAEWLKTFRRRLLAWYRVHARVLPWRANQDPYRVWISEIMLQQTQVATVVPYFERFVAAFPGVAELAAAPEEQVLRLWEGLGYYRRARQLHAAARAIVERHDGSYPRTEAEVLALPGVGRYTAGAILSIAYDLRLPILEANTRRLYARLLAERGDVKSGAVEQRLWAFAEQLLPRRQCGSFNQALMELGAEVCTPREPDCEHCPVAALCPARAGNLQPLIPAAAAKTRFEDVREVAVVVKRDAGAVLVNRYQAGERWAGLWDFVRFACPASAAPAAAAEGAAAGSVEMAALQAEVARRTGCAVELTLPRFTRIKHGVTRYRITLDVYRATAVRWPKRLLGEYRWADVAELESLPFSTTGRKIARLLSADEAGS